MSMIINPGSGPVAVAGAGWENTYEVAKATAAQWLQTMQGEGIRDVELLESDPAECTEGRWRFRFRHTVTGVEVTLDTHGVTDQDAYTADGHIFGPPRIYWRGDSGADPSLADWAADGYEAVQTYRPL